MLVESFTDIYHPIWEHLHGLADEGIRHLFVVGIGHGTSNGGKGIDIAAKGNGEFDSVHIVFGIEEADDGWAYGARAGSVKAVETVDIGIFHVGPIWIIGIQKMIANPFFVFTFSQKQISQKKNKKN